ncbi:hypothetical protein ALQ74_101100 [Pseudomonas savastanoi pv. glycinea]|uniref:Uncharacterized protein n=5 Tax=Pseudomonas syringae group TaxID=136849 RepID=A0A9X0H569_PSESX|nr:hypothetical protein ALO73_101052 [Pseudomonas syringae pv. daphniphylli]RMM57784.1 hypothetical protein ALQ74_101100 [Pseudomonas savastanoi pv. glycinea]RMQ56682.1 hypothetical protein ALQ02_100917 [Pseudomonas savastanoi pv. phaseolicola]RMT09303.1 hypothetical protein ALP53_100952 [Pseudomonas savastanoi pv. phaseolicola]
MGMEPFEPIRDFFHRRHAHHLDKIFPFVRLLLLKTDSHRTYACYPSPIIKMAIMVNALEVGDISYTISPLQDRLFVYGIEISREYKRRGYGLAALWRLHRMHGLPIVPVSIISSNEAHRFWHRSRQILSAAGAIIQPDIHRDHVYQEQQSWKHLIPESSIDRSIREHEEWMAREAIANRNAAT